MSNVNDLEKEKFGESGGEVGVKVLLIHGDEWKTGVANLAALPGSGNTTGDLRQTLDTGIIYRWSGSAWVSHLALLQGGNTFTGLQTINQSGTARALDIIHTGNSKAIGITSSNTSEYVIDIQGASLTSGRFVNLQGTITNGRGIHVETTGVYTGAGLLYLNLPNATTGTGLRIDYGGTGPSAVFNGGNVCIGTTTSIAKLTISGSSTAPDSTGIVRIDSNTGTNDIGIRIGAFAGVAGAGYSFIQSVRTGADNNGNLVLNGTGSGNVGIGKILPDSKLHVYSGVAGAVATFESTGEYTAIKILNSTGGVSDWEIRANDNLNGLAPYNVFSINSGSTFNPSLVIQPTSHVATFYGKVGISITAPTASIHIKAGTATAGTAPLKLTSGTNLTTPENGAFEYDGTNLYFTTGGLRKTVTLL